MYTTTTLLDLPPDEAYRTVGASVIAQALKRCNNDKDYLPRNEAYGVIGDHEDWAKKVAAQYVGAGASATLGPIRTVGAGGWAFDLLISHEGIADPLTITVAQRAAVHDVWSTWGFFLEEAGLHVQRDAETERALDEASDIEEAWHAEHPGIYHLAVHGYVPDEEDEDEDAA
jgi:hypothetical protein